MSAPAASLLADSRKRYGLVSRALHWLMAYLILWQSLMLVGWRMLDEDTMRAAARFGPSHAAAGLLVLALVLPRAANAVANRRRRPGADPGPVGMLARAGHMLLYLLMFANPALAVTQVYANGDGLALGSLQLFPATGREVEALALAAGRIHTLFGWAMVLLVAGHVTAALGHHFIGRAGTLGRMLGRLR